MMTMKHVMYLLRHFNRQHGRDAAIATLLYGAVVAICFWGGCLLSLAIPATLNLTLSSLCLAHVARTSMFGPSEFCLTASQRLIMLAGLLSLIVPLVLFARANMDSPERCKLVFLPLISAGLASVYVDFVFAGIIQKMVPRS
jgi:hypothetical protein